VTLTDNFREKSHLSLEIKIINGNVVKIQNPIRPQ